MVFRRSYNRRVVDHEASDQDVATAHSSCLILFLELLHYALDICSHGPTPGGGWGKPRKLAAFFFFLLLHTRDLLYRQKRQCNENITDCGGKVPCFCQLTIPAVWLYSRG